MSVSKTALLNKALTLVGAPPITSITQDTNNARILTTVYEVSLRSILSECKWNFATKRVNLSVSTETLAWTDVGETIIYIKPTDIIRIFGVNAPNIRWREEGDFIISDSSGLGLRYVAFVDDPTKFPGLFTDAFVDKLASDIAYQIVNSSSLGEKYLKKFEQLSLPKATAANSQSGIQQRLQDDEWELSKFFDNQQGVSFPHA